MSSKRREIDWERPWDRQKGETERSYEVYRAYQALPPNRRSVRAAYEHVKGKEYKTTPGRVMETAAHWSWKLRAAANDDRQVQIAREAEDEAIREMVKRHASVSLMFLQKTIESIQQTEAEDIPVAALPRFFETAVRMERLSRGLTTETTEVRGSEDEPLVVRSSIDPSTLTPEQARVLLSLQREAAVRVEDVENEE